MRYDQKQNIERSICASNIRHHSAPNLHFIKLQNRNHDRTTEKNTDPKNAGLTK
jgi:hypothetical protein